jgi:hypothetical protein
MLGTNNLRLSSHAYNTWLATVPTDTKESDLLSPSYWKHHTRTLRPMDVIRVLSEDGTWESWLTVIKPEPPAMVYVSLLFHARHASAEEATADDLTVKWRGAVHQFCIVRRRADGEDVIAKNLYPKSQAEMELLRLRSRAA